MRGRLYPQPHVRYERFRLNPYSPLYEGLALFASAPPVENIRPELHGPYALPGALYSARNPDAPPRHRFFPEIGRAAFSPGADWNVFSWPTVTIPPQAVITLTAMIISPQIQGVGIFVKLSITGGDSMSAFFGGSENGPYPIYGWMNVDGTSGHGRSEGKLWPPNTWFTLSATFRPGSVRGYLSNWGIIDVTLQSGQWPNTLAGTRFLRLLENKYGVLVSDTLVHLRELSLTELDAISDYGNVDLRVPGEAPLILPVRTYWPSVLSVLSVAPSYLKRRSLGVRVGTREAAL